MKNHIYKEVYLILMFVFFNLLSFGQSYNWVKQVGGPGPEIGRHICSDLVGNIYVAGHVGSPQVYYLSDTLNVSGVNDLLLIKYDISGNELWKMQFGGNNSSTNPYIGEAITDLIFDSINNCIYLSGVYYETCTIDTITLSTNPGSRKGFVSRIDVNGNCIWAKNFGGGGIGISSPRFDTDKNGDIFMVFDISTAGIFDTIPVNSGGYFGKMNSDGNINYIKRICSLYPQFQRSVFSFENIIVLNSKVFVFGASYDSLTLDTILLSCSNYYSQVVSVWDTSGSILWASQSCNTDIGYGTMSVNTKGDIYIASGCNGPFITFLNDTIQISNAYGGYLMKLNSNGNIIWHKSLISGQWISCFGSFIDATDYIYFTGNFRDSLLIDNFKLIASTTNEELFISKFDSTGNCIGVRQGGQSTGYDIIGGLNDDIFVTGQFRNTGTFGSISILSYGSSDMFLANISAITGSGGNERAINNQLIIYANPNKGSFRIKLPDALTDLTGAILTVYDVQGKEVARFNLEQTSDHPQLEINNAIAGFYTVRLVKGKQVFNGKLVVE